VLVPKSQASYMEANTQKDEETGDYALKHTLMRLEHAARRLEFVTYALRKKLFQT